MKKNFVCHIGILMLVVSLLLSCNETDSSAFSGLKSSTGRNGELIVVIKDSYWDSPLGDSLYDLLSEPIPALPMPDEPYFEIIQTTDRKFNKLLQSHRNIMMVRIASDIDTPSIGMRKNVWAEPQAVFYLRAPSRESFMKLLSEKGESILNALLKVEHQRMVYAANKSKDKSIESTLRNKHITLSVPRGYRLDRETKDNLMWFRNEAPTYSQGILIYEYPYTDADIFTVDHLLNIRDEILKDNIHGPSGKAYMESERRDTTIMKTFKHHGHYAVELRGRWRTSNFQMGGPFVSLTIVDERRKRVVTAEGFVYAPGSEKRSYLQQLRGIVYTLKAVD